MSDFAAHWGQKNETIKQLMMENARLRHDAKLGQELETAVCMHTHFTGEPPYVGTEGLVLAIKESRKGRS